jgi:hypothetical protein
MVTPVFRQGAARQVAARRAANHAGRKEKTGATAEHITADATGGKSAVIESYCAGLLSLGAAQAEFDRYPEWRAA